MLYRYAEAGETSVDFDQALPQQAFAPKKWPEALVAGEGWGGLKPFVPTHTDKVRPPSTRMI